MDPQNAAIAQDWKDLLSSVNLTSVGDPSLLASK
jgi:hypothetical protein